MTRWKTVLYFALCGGALGWIAASLMAPTLLKWYFSPAGTVDAMCKCRELIEQTTVQYFRFQAIGFGIGVVAGLVLGILWVRWRARKAAGQAAAPTAGR